MPHGVAAGCPIHDAGDPLLGQPLCPRASTTGAVLWNAHVSGLWQRTTNRRLLRTSGAWATSGPTTVTCALSYVKAAEFQHRGLVHLHVVAPGRRPRGARGSPPPPWLSTGRSSSPPSAGRPSGHHVGARRRGSVRARSAGAPRWRPPSCWPAPSTTSAHMAVAAYVAKYATKTADSTGALAYRIERASEIARLRVNDHQRRLVETAWVARRARRVRRSFASGVAPTPSATGATWSPRAPATRPPSPSCGRRGPSTGPTPALAPWRATISTSASPAVATTTRTPGFSPSTWLDLPPRRRGPPSDGSEGP